MSRLAQVNIDEDWSDEASGLEKQQDPLQACRSPQKKPKPCLGGSRKHKAMPKKPKKRQAVLGNALESPEWWLDQENPQENHDLWPGSCSVVVGILRENSFFL